jgi:phenylalanyl-tRNA synthetase beta chain
MCGFGFFELLTDSFIPDTPEGRMTFFESGEPLRVRNPVTVEKSLLRRSLVPNMLEAHRKSRVKAEGGAGMFEVSVVYLPGSEKLPVEKHTLAFLCPDGYLQAKGALEALLESLRAGEAAFADHTHPALTGGRSCVASLDGKECAYIGDLSADLTAYYDLSESCAVCEMDLDHLYSHAGGKISFKPIARFPKVLRDMALVANEDMLWQQLRGEIKSLGIELLQRIELFDAYRGKQLPAGKKSIAFSLEFQSSERTLTGEEVDELVRRIALHLADKFGAELRK